MSTVPSLLEQLHLSPDEAAGLSPALRNRLLSFLAAWQGHEELLACVEAIGRPDLVSLQDRRAEALEGLGRLEEALAVRRQRLEKKESTTAHVALGRSYVRAEQASAALEIAQKLTAEEGAPAYSWGLLGDVYLQLEELDNAEAAFLHYQKASPGSRQPLFGLMQVHERRGDAVTAAAYAVRAYTVDEGQYDVPTSLLRRLRDFFETSNDQNRLLAASEQLEMRFRAELEELAEWLQQEIDPAGLGRVDVAMPAEAPRLRSQISDLGEIPVSDTERRELEEAAQRYFGFSHLLEAQAEIMASARRGENVLAVLPTGGGKSLTYQLPALLDEGLTLVISPLIALMKDQVDSLPPAVRPKAFAINSSLDGAVLRQAVADAARGRYRLLYAAPERLRQPPFLHALRQAGVTRLVIDEAHCVSVWGHDFRPDYLNIARVHRELGSPPVLAVTATAPPRVRQDIERRLFGEATTLRVIATDTYRANLHLSVIHSRNKDEKLRRLLALCHALEGSGIVYAGTRARCEEIAGILRQQGIDARHYHAGIDNRSEVQDRFMRGETRIIVATVAFGMGVDKSDIRFIIHYAPPDSVESYYQEAGRAGRDGQPAHCILLYSNSDKGMLTRHANMDIIPVEFLRSLYAAVRARLRGRATAPIAVDDLCRDLRSDDTTVRVGLSTLEEAELLQRHHDVPYSVNLVWRPNGNREDGALAVFAKAARLRPGQVVTRSFLALGEETGRPLPTLEAELLAWQDSGELQVEPIRRDALITLLPPPVDASTRIDSLLSQYAAIQKQRVDEIVAYARNRRCRHGYLSNYLGGRVRRRCEACDNCQEEELLPAGDGHLPEESEQLQLILRALEETSWGRQTLTLILRGERNMQERAGHSPFFGRLAFRSKSALNKMIDGLQTAGYLSEVQLSHGGVALSITQSGREAALGKRSLDGLVIAETKVRYRTRASKGNGRKDDGAPTLDAAAATLYEDLVEWRRERAQEDGVPAYVVAHNSVLRDIASRRPQSPASLLALNGIGPATLEKYGAEILALVREHLTPAER